MSQYQPGLCETCNLPWENHQPDYAAAVEVRKRAERADVERKLAAQARERAEFDRGVAERVAEKMAVHHLAQWHLDQAHGIASPRPRDVKSTDRREFARIKAREDASDHADRVARHVQRLRGADAEYIQTPEIAPDKSTFFKGMKFTAWFNGVSVKDAPADDRFETRDAF